MIGNDEAIMGLGRAPGRGSGVKPPEACKPLVPFSYKRGAKVKDLSDILIPMSKADFVLQSGLALCLYVQKEWPTG